MDASQLPKTPLVDPTILLRLRMKAARIDRRFSMNPEPLPDETIMPCLSTELAGGPKFAQVRMAVGADALFFQVDVQGKKHLPWCRESRMEDSDGLHVWINTRHSPEIQRANKYCQRFGFFPLGKGRKADMPFASWGLIPRASEDAPTVADDRFAIRARLVDGRYRVVASLHIDALHGLDLRDFPTLGLYYAVIDRELGWQALMASDEYPVHEIPGMWAQWDLST
ncbi:MAG: hypothetical protein D6753_16480 [Planctomycetota bacterium]|nr:MAG: hypothetical protein D6753_16480 [Planctomycetota bacterium]